METPHADDADAAVNAVNVSILRDEDQAEVAKNDSKTEEAEVDKDNGEELSIGTEVDKEELERDKIIEEVLVCSVTKPIENEKKSRAGNCS